MGLRPAPAVGRPLVDPQHVGERGVEQPVDPGQHVHQQVGQPVALGPVQRRQVRPVDVRGQQQPRRGRPRRPAPTPASRWPRPPSAPGRVGGTGSSRPGPTGAARPAGRRGRGRRRRSGRGGGRWWPHLLAPVLEHEHVVHLGPVAQCLGALGPQVDHPAGGRSRPGRGTTRRGGGCRARPRSGRRGRRASGWGRRARRRARAPPGRRRRTGTRRPGRLGRCWRDPAITVVAPVRSSMRASDMGRLGMRSVAVGEVSAGRPPRRRPLEGARVPGRPQGDVDHGGPRRNVAAQRVGRVRHAGPDDRPRSHGLGAGAELGGQRGVVVRHTTLTPRPTSRGRGRRPRSGGRAPLAGRTVPRAGRTEVPAVGVAGDGGGGAALARPADPHRQRSLERPGLAVGVPQGHVRALERGDAVVEQGPDGGGRLVEEVEPLGGRRERQAERLVLGLGPAGAEADLGPPARQVVDGGGRLGQHAGMAVPAL